MAASNYTEKTIKCLSPREHIRLRPGMYIGKLGNGTAQDDGIYVLIKEIVDNAIDEHSSGHGKRIDIVIDGYSSIGQVLPSSRRASLAPTACRTRSPIS